MLASLAVISSVLVAAAALRTVWLDDLDLGAVRQGWGTPTARLSVSNTPLKIGAESFERGIGTHAPSWICLALDGKATRFQANVGVDGSAGKEGSVAFRVLVDGKVAFDSGTMKGGEPPKPIDLSIRGAREVLLVVTDGEDAKANDAANWADAQIVFEGKEPAIVPYTPLLHIDLSKTAQTIDNFAASDSWTIEPIGSWSEASRRKVADLLFSQDRGIGLSGWRFNLGGGVNHKSITNPWRTVASFEPDRGKFDWAANPGKRWMLEAARDRGVTTFVAYSVTPPMWLTRNGLTNCTDGLGTTNLKQGAEADYAKYLVDQVRHFTSNPDPKRRVRFTHISPINEPDFEWNGQPNPASQEGNRSNNEDIWNVLEALSKEIDSQGLRVRLLAPEASSPQAMVQPTDWMGKKHGGEYANYLGAVAKRPDQAVRLNPVLAYHSYWADRMNRVVKDRRRLREALDKLPKLEVWQTEYCQMDGPFGEGGHGRDLGMTLALNVARLIHYDLTVVNANAWQWWLAMTSSDYKDGLVYTDWQKPGDDESIYASKLLWALGNYSRFVRPGMKRVEIEHCLGDVDGLLPSAFVDPSGKRLVVVLVNRGMSKERVQFSIKGTKAGDWLATPFVTSDQPGDDLQKRTSVRLEKGFSVPPRSVVTLVCERG